MARRVTRLDRTIEVLEASSADESHVLESVMQSEKARSVGGEKKRRDPNAGHSPRARRICTLSFSQISDPWGVCAVAGGTLTRC